MEKVSCFIYLPEGSKALVQLQLELQIFMENMQKIIQKLPN